MLAVAVCVLGSFTSIAALQRAVAAEGSQRKYWLIVAGGVAGISIWTTHFTAILGYAWELDLRTIINVAVLSAASCITLATLGWMTGFGTSRLRGLVGGAVVGVALAVSHYIDMAALQVPGIVRYEPVLVVASLVGGLTLCAFAGWLLQLYAKLPLAWPSGVALIAGILCLHFVAMASITIVHGPLSMDAAGVGLSTVGSIVVGASLLIIAAALGLAFHSQHRARAASEDHERLLKALADLQASEAHHRASIELNPQIPWLADTTGKVIEISPRWAELVGVPVEQALGDGWAAPVHPDDLPGVEVLWRRAIETRDGTIADVRYRVRLRDGLYRWFRARALPRRSASGEIIAWYGSLEDIDEQVRAELELRKSEERYRLASSATNDVIWDWSYEERITTWAGAIEEVLGYPEARAGMTQEWWIERIHPDDLERVLRLQADALEGGSDQWSHEYRFRRSDGEYLNMISRCLIVRDERGVPVRLVGSLLNVTDQRRIEDDLHRAAHEDNLTKLPNRRLFGVRINQAVEQAGACGSCVGLVVIDLNNFKSLNDTLGHAAGDALLCEVANRLKASAPAGATVARLGGDEFAIILPDLKLDDARRETVRDLLAGLDEPVLIEGFRTSISVCAGAAIWPRDAESVGDLLKCADLALYAAKAEHPGAIRGFTPSMRQASVVRAAMLSNARLALDEDRVLPFYQPKLCLRTGNVVGFEALLRWHDSAGDIQSPGSIAAAFEDVELSTRITERMLDRIIRDCGRWAGMGVDYGRIAFNASAADFRRDDFANQVLRSMSEAGLPPSHFELEVTESVFIGRNTERIIRTLEILRSEGMTIALDDFGTGYASLTHLQQFPVDVLKIDKSFIAPIGSGSSSSTAVVDAVLQMARSLGIAAVAEGVETPHQAGYLRARGCDIGQGYLFGRPAEASHVPRLCQRVDGSWFATHVVAARS
ncbi:bifunctional diguanylate cyclase/phosphodiesterase [Methylobacterium gnaphalii]|uniref:bifunctional diguanylate cyclase/phosphodiesterase n=1 Tax=Methylobacterium gnaphalii TaxID=1010610 RepID=UPI0014796F8B|nr:EAL domain-containing protein [Methylobacterium gnaphalii]